MTPTREKRLLILATSANANHKMFYSQYCDLMCEGLVMWTFGTAHLTEAGYERLRYYTYG